MLLSLRTSRTVGEGSIYGGSKVIGGGVGGNGDRRVVGFLGSDGIVGGIAVGGIAGGNARDKSTSGSFV